MLSVCFVDADAPAGGDGQSWAGAYQDLQAALDYVEGLNSDEITENDVDQIWIAEGVYRPDSSGYEDDYWLEAHFKLLDGVDLYGGFTGTESTLGERDCQAHETILSGDLYPSDYVRTVVICPESVETTLNGLVIQRGGRTYSYNPTFSEVYCGGGIFTSGTLRIEDCLIRDNMAALAGGGVFNSGTLEIIGSTIENNQCRDDGGGIYSTGSLTITGSSITRNAAESGGGGLFIKAGDALLTDVVISHNSNRRGRRRNPSLSQR